MSSPLLQIESLRSFRDHVSSVSRTPVPIRRGRGFIDRRIQLALMLIEENSSQQIAIGDIARLVHLSPGRLSHLFKSETGVAIQQYLTRIRIASAKSQLESSFLSIKEIAALVGFTSVTRFTSAFKSLVGMTPAQYRKLAASFPQHRKHIAIAKSAKE